jgi:hypothetical protein
MVDVVKIDIVSELLGDMKRSITRSFITKNTAIEDGKYKVYKVYIFWVIPIYKSITVLTR